MLEKVKKFLAINGSEKLMWNSLIATVISGLITHHMLIIHGYSNPDGICEGLTYYKGGDWALAGCGRWAVRYMNEMTCNIMIPLYVVMMYCICIWLSVVLLAKLWKLSDLAVILSSIIMITTPVVVEQLTYTYTTLMYAFACIFSVIFVYVIFRCNRIVGVIIGSISVALMLGLYQSYIGMLAGLVFMTLIIDLIDLRENKKIILNCITGIASSLIGCFVYLKILDWDLTRRGLDNSGTRVAQFEIATILESFSDSSKVAYMQFFEFVKEPFMHRGVVTKVCVVIIVLALIWEIIQLIKEKKYIRPILVAVIFLLLPAGLNIIRILIPYNELREMMQYQNILIVPFMFACIGYTAKYKIHKPIKAVASLAVIVLAWTYILAGNATYKCYELSYNHINSQMQIAVSRVYDLEGYIKDETPILMAGFPNDTVLKNNMDIYQYAENLYGNPVFWVDMHGATRNRYLYFLNYFGIDARQFSDDEYIRIIDTGEFAGMPVWPDKGSVKMIDGYAVIKFTDDPPRE